MRPRILIAEPLDFSSQAAELLGRAGDVVLQTTSAEELPHAFAEYDVVWVRLAARITAEMLGPRPRCCVLVVPTTGLDHIDLEACKQRGVRVVSLKGEVDFLRRVRATAELTLALTLVLLRRVTEAAASTIAGQWDRDRFRGREIYEKTVGIIGIGRLGSIVAGYFHALGATVLGYDPRSDFPHDVVRRIGNLHELLARSDIVCLMASYDAGTRHLLNAEAFNHCKPEAIFINTSRGGIVDERALLDAIESGRLAGAALDVLDGEPGIDAQHPVIRFAQTHPNVVVLPHLGGNTFESLEKVELFLAEKVTTLFEIER